MTSLGADDVLALVAEVRRLRAESAALLASRTARQLAQADMSDRADRYAVALAHIEAMDLHVMGCYAHVEYEEDDIEPRCPPECPTATAKRAREASDG